MNRISFFKYQGAGNDFILIDNRNLIFPKENNHYIRQLCDRRFGIGADGLILLENEDEFDFKMVYFNSDGKESTMCGNGGRCIVAFAKQLQIVSKHANFIAIDGPHKARVLSNDKVELGMADVKNIEQINETDFFLDTGSPHYVKIVNQFPADFVRQAKNIRNSDRFRKEGVNVNFIILENDTIKIRTFERGVEDETLACGTGAVAAAIAASEINGLFKYDISAKGGDLTVHFDSEYKQVVLNGSAVFVFNGSY